MSVPILWRLGFLQIWDYLKQFSFNGHKVHQCPQEVVLRKWKSSPAFPVSIALCFSSLSQCGIRRERGDHSLYKGNGGTREMSLSPTGLTLKSHSFFHHCDTFLWMGICLVVFLSKSSLQPDPPLNVYILPQCRWLVQRSNPSPYISLSLLLCIGE